MSTYDRRYPHMDLASRSTFGGAGDSDISTYRKFVTDVEKRTGTTGFYNTLARNVLFAYGAEPSGGPLAIPLRQIPGANVNDVVEYIRLGKAPRSEKDLWAEKQRIKEEYDRRVESERESDTRRPDALAYALFLERRRRGVQKVFLSL